MKRFTLTTFLLVFCILSNGIAETATRGKIELDMPNAPTPILEINLDKTFFSLFINVTAKLPEYAEYAKMIEGIFIRSYEKDNENLGDMTTHYQNILKKENWETLVKAKDRLHVNLLFAEEPGVVHGIFIIFTDDQEATNFVNIYGKIDFRKLGILFGKLMKSDFIKQLNEHLNSNGKGIFKNGMGSFESE